LAKTLKPGKPLRESLASHRAKPEEEIKTVAMRVQEIVQGREVFFFSILVAMVLLIGGAVVYWFLKSNETSLAAEQLSVAYAAYREAVYPSSAAPQPSASPAASPATVAEKAQAMARIAHEFPDNRTGAMASYLAGNAYLRAGMTAKAIPLLQSAVKRLRPADAARPFAMSALGTALEDEGRPKEALAVYGELESVGNEPWRFEGLLGRARVLKSEGKGKEAEGILDGLAAKFPEEAAVMGLGPQQGAPRPSLPAQVTVTPSGKVK
jgi:tetratricopeptide (TPR) repeat protein